MKLAYMSSLHNYFPCRGSFEGLITAPLHVILISGIMVNENTEQHNYHNVRRVPKSYKT